MEVFDLIVLGGGPAGYLAAERAGHAGLKTAVVEKRALGGVCLNEGCVPSKAFLNSAKYYNHALHAAPYGVTVTGVSIDHAKVVERKNKVVKQLVAGVGMQMKRNHVTVIEGNAVIDGKGDEGFNIKVNDTVYAAKKLIISTGSTAVVPPIPGVKEGIEAGFVMTNREILDMTTVPEKLVVIGGGVIGLEMAAYFNSIGSKVTVIEMLNKIAGPTEAEISKILLNNYKKKGVNFCLSCKVTGVGTNSVSYEENGETKTVEADKVLLSIGRRAFTQGIGLETIGVLTERGAIVTDENMRTNVPGVYATGDVNGKSMLAHTAYRESEVAVNHILGKKDKMRYNAIPAVIYTDPEVASVGETEETAKAKGMDVQVANVTMKFSGRYVAEVEGGDGICKLIVDKKYNRLVGVHLIGSYASEMIYGAALMIETELRIDDIKEIVFPHPTVCEVIREALFEL
ncbi:MAG: dihydrolipoyl dehydrogenase [Oscillospiraceae bacterium]|nr:dihydrolipoyl dehydrogenase [Oscillospiraceae bacterium]MBQ9938947.1 dihydrolipoyl dehydrogenase [Oscillospiraceae bacterium]